MHKPKMMKLLVLLVMFTGLAACGGGGGGGGSDGDTTSTSSSRDINGGGVKGPLANAVVTVYTFDPAQADFKGAVAATGTTNNAAAITGLALPFPVSPPYILEFTSNGGTTDITTGMAPVIATMRTVITQTLLDSGEQIYATPLTTMAVDIAIANSTPATTPAQFANALGVAADQVVSTLGFGMSGDIDIFDTPPLIDSTTTSTARQADVAAYRSAVEALTAVVYAMEQQSSGNTDTVLAELSMDLVDGSIDGMVGGNPSAVFSSTTLDILAQDPATLPIPNSTTSPVQTVADVQAILVAETATTGSTTSTTELAGGTIVTSTQPAETSPDSDGDGTLNADDAFPDDATENTDSDGDGLGDVVDTDDDNNGILDVDEGFAQTPTVSDTDGDGFDDGADNCPAQFNPGQTNTDGLGDGGDACDLDDDEDGTPDIADAFPLNVGEQFDADNDGTGDVADIDDDNDGINDTTEDISGTSADHDGDGTPNREDTDSDDDGVLDSIDFNAYDDTVSFNLAPVTANSTENTNEDTLVALTLDASDDAVAVGALVYTIVTGPTNGSLSGVAPNLTYTPTAESSGDDGFSFTVTDGAGEVSNLSTVTIVVALVNDIPVMDAVGPFPVAEDALNTTPVGTVTATDIDSTVTGFSIATGNTGNAFAIAADGVITVNDTSAIDFEVSTSFVLGITATDGVDVSTPQNVTISVQNANDVMPVVGALGPISIAEDIADSTLVDTAIGTDIDSAVTGFAIVSGNTGTAFAIAANGAITVNSTAAIDFEFATSFTLGITATDGVNVSSVRSVTVNLNDVNDTSPVVAAAQSFAISETAINTAVVGTVNAIDADTVGAITVFTITDGNSGSAFAIDAGGQITVNDTAAINFEGATSYVLSITAGDGINVSAVETVTINVNDANDTAPIVGNGQSFVLAEDAPDTTPVGIVTATDADTVGAINGFTIVGGDTGGAFAIDASGQITVNDTTMIDAEDSTSFTLAVTATDGVNTSLAENVTINITDTNDTAPIVAAAQIFVVVEGALNTSTVGTVTATDEDTVDTITGFSIVSGNTDTAFAIDAGGQITVADTSSIDFESSASFTLSVTATDGVNTSLAVNVTVNVSDVNDTAPIVAAAGPFALDENSANTTAVGSVIATDSDTIGVVTGFNIAAGNTGGAFAISSGGAITVANFSELDREISPSFTLTVTATDGANTSIGVDVIVNLSDQNDTPPVVAASQVLAVNSIAPNGTVVGTVVASDADTTGSITGFSITGTAFAIANDGEITVLDNSALLANAPYTLSVTATDGVNGFSAAESVTINVSTGGAVWDSFNWDDGSTWQ